MNNNKKPFFSVIIPTYNRAHTITRALDSVLKQEIKNFDIWVVDDGSTDDTQEVVERYVNSNEQVKINYLYQKNKGVSSARNLGIVQSKGEWCAFLDSDDEWYENKLLKQQEFIEKNPSICIVHGNETWIRNGKFINQKNIHKKYGGKIFMNCLPFCLISPSAVIIKRGLLGETRGFDEDFTVCEDYDLWLRITIEHEVGFIDDPIIKKYGGHEDQLSARYKAMDYYRVKSMIRVLKTYDLNIDERVATKKEILKKCDILLNGYKKHDNIENLKEIENIKVSVLELNS